MRIPPCNGRLLPAIAALLVVVVPRGAPAQAPSPPAAASAMPSAPPPVGLVYSGPGCLDAGTSSINLVAVLFDHFASNQAQHGDGRAADGAVYIGATGSSALSRGDRMLFPETNAADARAVGHFLDAAAGATREVVEADVPVLDSPYELVFQMPAHGHFDWLGVIETETGAHGGFPDARRRTGDVVRYTSPAGPSVLALELHPEESASAAPEGDPPRPGSIPAESPAGPAEAWRREFAATIQVDAPDDHVRLVNIGKRLGTGARTVAELAALRRPDDLFLHPGGISPRKEDPAESDACGSALAAVHPDAVVPRESDLALGPAGLAAYGKKHGLPFIAANLESAVDGRAPFPRFAVFERGGLTIAVLGVVDRDQLAQLPAAVRAQWKVERPVLALERARVDLERQLRRRPDLTIALEATDGETHARLLGTVRVDVALGLFNRGSLLSTRETVEVDPAGSGVGRERVRNEPVLLAVAANEASVGRIEATFGAATGRVAPLQRLTHETHAVAEAGPIDPALDATWRRIEESGVPRDARVVLPDAVDALGTHPELEGLVWGRRILHRSGYRDYPRQYPGRFSDPLWMRLVTNLLKAGTGAELALSRNLPRRFDTVGPVTHDVYEEWMSAPDAVQMVTVTGADLLRIAERMVRQRDDAQIPATSVIFAAGFDPDRQIVGGRPIDPAEAYRVAVTDAVLEMGDLAPLFAAAPREGHFAALAGGRFAPDPGGQPLRLAQVVTAAIDPWARPGPGDFDPQARPAFEASLLDQSDVLTGRWLLRLDELSVQAGRYRNTENVDTFAASRETRATTPNNFSLALGLDTALLYDGPAIAWENRVQAKLQMAVIDLPGQDIPPQEQADDVLGSTELRLNAVRLEIGDGKVPVVPFIQAALDTEFTATPDPESDDPDATLPHQFLVRGSTGVVSHPGPRLREVRLGALVQRDLSEATPHDDFGALAGYRFAWPLLGPVVWESALDVRYTVPDDDDRPTDLGLVAATTQKLLVPVFEGLSVFGLLDAWFARGKVESNRELGGSYILGGGLQFARIFKP